MEQNQEDLTHAVQDLVNKLRLDKNASMDDVCDSALSVIQEQEKQLKQLDTDLTNAIIDLKVQLSFDVVGDLDAGIEKPKVVREAIFRLKQYEKTFRQIQQHHQVLCTVLKAAKNSNHSGYYTHYFRDNLTDLLVKETERVYKEAFRDYRFLFGDDNDDISDLDF